VHPAGLTRAGRPAASDPDRSERTAMTTPDPFSAALADRLQRAWHETPTGAGLVSITLAAPEVCFRGLPRLDGPYWYWARPETETYLLGLGEAWRSEASGEGRLDTLARSFEALRRRWQRLDPDSQGTAPPCFTGIAFDPDDPMEGPWQGFPNALLAVPEVVLRRDGNHCTLTFTAEAGGGGETVARWLAVAGRLLGALQCPPDPSGTRTPLTRILSDPEESEWIGLIEQANRDIEAGAIDKVVPARRIRVCAERRLDGHRLLAALGYMYPCCMLFAANLGGRTVASATPERLVTRHGDEVVSDAIGGTARRAPNERHDQELGDALQGSRKARHEHALVVEAIRAALAPVCEELSIPDAPRIYRLRHLQHLWTPVRGRAPRESGLLDLARRLHPTPAVGGTPRAAALDWLQRHGELQRGWYSGAVGWLDADGHGELAVLLRCALVNGECADLYAGAGIVSASDPEAELAETALKLEAMLEALENA